MGRLCSVCLHPQREAIDKELIEGSTLSGIVAKYSGITKTSIFRHKEKHLPLALSAARDAEVVANGDSLLGQVQRLQDKAMELLNKAEKAGELRTALVGIKEARSCLELLARLQGQLQAETRLIVESAEIQALVGQITIILQQEIKDPHTLQAIAAKLQEVDI